MKQNALHWAAKRGFKTMAEFLLQNGIALHQKDMANRTPRDLAQKNEFFEIMKVIEDFDINAKNKKEKQSFEIEKIDLNFKSF